MSNIELLRLSALASDFRKKNDLNDNEPFRIRSVLQRNNILTFFFPMSDKFSGMAVKIDGYKGEKLFMLVNSNSTLGRQHFTICHELYHLFYQSEFKAKLSITEQFDKNGDPEEYKADIFASYLLLPEHGVVNMIPPDELGKKKISLKTILSIEQYYSCSRRALIKRLMEMKIIDKNKADGFYNDITKNALQYGFSIELYQKGNNNLVIGDYGIKAKNLFDEGVISESTYLTFLEDIGIDVSNF